MPVSARSRYSALTIGLAPDAAGASHATIPARWRSGTAPTTPPYVHTVLAGDTIEALASSFLGSSSAWWMIADANPTLYPADLEPGTRLLIPTDASPGRVERTRSF